MGPAVAGCRGRGAIAGFQRRALAMVCGRVTTHFEGVDVVPLQGAIGREGDHQLSGSGRGAIAGCHCSVLWVGEEG